MVNSIQLLLPLLALFLPAWALPMPEDEVEACLPDGDLPPSDDNSGDKFVVMWEIHQLLVTRLFVFADNTRLVVQTLITTIQEHCVMRLVNPLKKQQLAHEHQGPVTTDGTLPTSTLLKSFSHAERAAAICIIVFAALMSLTSLCILGLFVYRKLTGDERKKGADGILVRYGFNDQEKQECQRLMDAAAEDDEPEVAPAYHVAPLPAVV